MTAKAIEFPVVIESVQTADNPLTEGGTARLKKTISDYAQQLYGKSIDFGRVGGISGEKLEVTGEHVRRAAESLARSNASIPTPKWVVALQVLEYACSIAVGIACSNLTEKWGIWMLVAAAVVGVVSFVTRMVKGGGQ